MEQKIDVYEILKDMPTGIKLYSPMCGEVTFSTLADSKGSVEAIWTENQGGEYTFDKFGRYTKGGECLLFPSEKMRDWGKFFKRGDIVEFKNSTGSITTCIFDRWENEQYTVFACRYANLSTGVWMDELGNRDTNVFYKSNAPESYIEILEEHYGGKLNRETLEIVKQKPAFEIGRLYVFNEDDEDGELTIIGQLIRKNESQDTLTFGNQYEIENEKLVTDQAFDLTISAHKELREATKEEQETFERAHKDWCCKQQEEDKKFKPLDKVLVRNGEGDKWKPAFFLKTDSHSKTQPYTAFQIGAASLGDFSQCIPFEGNEWKAFTDGIL